MSRNTFHKRDSSLYKSSPYARDPGDFPPRHKNDKKGSTHRTIAQDLERMLSRLQPTNAVPKELMNPDYTRLLYKEDSIRECVDWFQKSIGDSHLLMVSGEYLRGKVVGEYG